VSALLVLVAGIVLAVSGWRWSARSVDGSARVAIIAVLGVTAASFNVIVPVPSIEATTTVVLCAALALGARSGAAVGLVAIVASSVTGGIGIWTIWQVVAVLALALLGSSLAMTGRDADWFAPRRLMLLAGIAFLAAVVWDVVTTAGSMASIAPSGQGLVATLLLGAAFTITHAVFSAIFTVAGGPPLLHALSRARHRLDGGSVIPSGDVYD
jgi:hypothetical protein